jgi:hypothetical protein
MKWTRFRSVTRGAGPVPAVRWALAGAAAVAAVAGGLAGLPAAQAATAAGPDVPCSVTALNNAITSAPSGAILVLKPGCVFVTPGPLTEIKQNLTIEGSNDTIKLAGRVMADIVAGDTLLTIDGATVSISDLTFADGNGFDGAAGAIDNIGGTVSLSNTNFTDNDGDFGGAIQNSSHGSLTVTSSTFTGNDAGSGAVAACSPAIMLKVLYGGGAIANLNDSSLSISGDTFYDNQGTDGGAIYNQSGSVWTPASPVKNLFTDNEAVGTGPCGSTSHTLATPKHTADAIPPAYDGYGGAIDNLTGSIDIDNATYSGNSALEGGAIYTDSGNSTLTDSGLSGNSADYYGGAIYNSKRLNLVSDGISGNDADFGGGIFTGGGHTTLSQNTLVTGNLAYEAGGGIFRNYGTISLTTGSLVSLNLPNDCVNTTVC